MNPHLHLKFKRSSERRTARRSVRTNSWESWRTQDYTETHQDRRPAACVVGLVELNGTVGRHCDGDKAVEHGACRSASEAHPGGKDTQQRSLRCTGATARQVLPVTLQGLSR